MLKVRLFTNMCCADARRCVRIVCVSLTFSFPQAQLKRTDRLASICWSVHVAATQHMLESGKKTLA